MKYRVNATKEHYYYIDVEAESLEEAEEKASQSNSDWTWLDEGTMEIFDVYKAMGEKQIWKILKHYCNAFGIAT